MPVTLRHNQDGSYIVGLNAYAVHTTVTSSAATANLWLCNNYPPRDTGLVVGLAIECRPTPIRSSSAGRRTIALIQLCIGHRCLIFQIFRADIVPRTLHMLLGFRACRFVAVGATEIARRLFDEYDLVVQNVMDLGGLSACRTGRYHLHRAEIGVLAREVIRLTVNVGPLSAWDRSQLSMNHIVTACAHAFLAQQIGSWLLR